MEKKRFLGLLLCAALLLMPAPVTVLAESTIWDGVSIDVATWYTDPGEDTFYIENGAQLAGLASLVNSGIDFNGKTIELVEDIVLNDTAGWQQWDSDTPGLNVWTPIGSYVNDGDDETDKPFSGTFDGQGHTISGIYISTGSDYQGLFGYCYNGEISSLSVERSYMEGGNFIGGIAAYTMNCEIDDCSNSGTVRGSAAIGGIAGAAGAAISNSSNSGSVVGGYGVGGISGMNGGTAELTNCTNSGEISTADEYDTAYGFGTIGGVAGRTNADVSGCSNSGTVTTTGSDLGGIVGAASGVTIQNCYSTGDLSGSSKTGGIIGSGEYCTIQYCYSTGAVSGGTGVGGIAGLASDDEEDYISNISECYSTADVSGSQHVGGIAGQIYGGSTISACYSTGDISCSSQLAGGIAGILSGGGTVSNCYTLGFVSGPTYVCGIVGYVDFTAGENTVENCIALNSGITATNSGGYLYRINPYRSSNSYAWSAMPMIRGGDSYSPTDPPGYGWNGTDASSAELKTDVPWTAAGFTAANGWDYTAGSLPVLTNTGGAQDSTLPLYIEPFPSSAGDGSEENPYLISEAVQLAAVAEYVNSGDAAFASACYELVDDIDLGGISCWRAIGMGLVNSSTIEHPFTGSFDGCGHAISNMTISGLDNWAQGLFGYLGSGGTVKNIKLTDCDVGVGSAFTPYVGGIAGFVGSGASVLNCAVSGAISGDDSVGGIAGYVLGTVKNCYSTAAVSGNSDVGNIAGGVSGTVVSCYYLDEAAPGSDEATVKTAAELSTAEMAWILNTTNSAEVNSGIWAQGPTPVFSDGINAFAVYKITLSGSETPAAVYSNPDGTVTLPQNAIGQNGKAVSGWYTEPTCNTPYSAPSTLTSDITIYGEFSSYIITASAGDGGTVSPDGAVSVAEGGSQTFTFTPNANYSIASVKVDEVSQGAVSSYTFDNVTAHHTISVVFSYTGGSGGSSNSRRSTPATPTYNAVVSGIGMAGTTLPVNVNTNTGSAAIDLGSITKDLFAGTGTAVINMPSIPGANSYTLGMPAASLSGSQGEGALTLNTDAGSITVPLNMLTGIPEAEGKEVGITIGQGDKSGLPAEVQSAIGDRPIVQLTLTLGGTQTEWSNPNAPVTVSIPYTPTAAELANPESIVVWYIDGNGNVVTIPNGHYDPATGTVTFSTTHFSDYAVAYNKVSFNDVAKGAWYNKAVSFIAAREITSGTGNGNYSPDAKLTRGEFIVLMMRAYGIAPDTNPTDNFSDAGNTYYTGYLAAAKRLGITSGVGNNMYAPGNQITRQEMFTLLYNALKIIGKLPEGNSGKSLSSFGDADDIASWAKDAMTLLIETGTIGGSNGALTPTGTTTRTEMAQVLYNLLGK